MVEVMDELKKKAGILGVDTFDPKPAILLCLADVFPGH
jgi:hypothetical protein